jgi:hypothetical protein
MPGYSEEYPTFFTRHQIYFKYTHVHTIYEFKLSFSSICLGVTAEPNTNYHLSNLMFNWIFFRYGNTQLSACVYSYDILQQLAISSAASMQADHDHRGGDQKRRIEKIR